MFWELSSHCKGRQGLVSLSMVPNKKKKEQPAKNPFSKEPEHLYYGNFHDLPIAPEEHPENVEEDFPSKEDIKFEDKDLSYLEELSKGKSKEKKVEDSE